MKGEESKRVLSELTISKIEIMLVKTFICLRS